MTQLRILRSNFRWEIPAGHNVRYGGDNPVVLKYDEKLQYGVDYGNTLGPKWYDVPIVEEGEKPEHPADKRRREEAERRQQWFKDHPIKDITK